MMKKLLTGSIASIVFASGLVAPVWTEETMGADEKTIRSLEEQEVIAVLNEDIPALERLWSDQMVVNNPQNGITATRADVIDRVRRGLIRYSSFERRIEALRFSGDVAIVMGAETVVRKGGPPGSDAPIHRRFTNIWKRSGSTWHSIARHANVVVRS
jgi:ketosteroid isomerase-like protein